MDTLLLEYKLKVHKLERSQLLKLMGWSESTRQARCIRGENWTIEEARTLIGAGFSLEDIEHIFFTHPGNKSDHDSGGPTQEED